MMETRHTIIMVDDSFTNLAVGKNILGDQYNTITLNSCEELFKTLDTIAPDLILLDVEMPHMNGYQGHKILRENPKTAHIPVIYLTSHTDPSSEMEGLSMGAVDYVHKPFLPNLLRKRIEVHLTLADQEKRIKELTENLFDVIKERTNDMLDLNRLMLNLLENVCRNVATISVEQLAGMREYIAGEMDHIIAESDSLGFVPKPVAVFKEHEQEYRIMLQKILNV